MLRFEESARSLSRAAPGRFDGCVAGVMVWRLAGATYRADVETLCDAESRSGFDLRKDMPALTGWLRGHLATPEGNELLFALGQLPMADRPLRLRAVAESLGLAACPMASSYERLVADGDYRGELQSLCSYETFPDLAQADDDARLQALEDWIETQASNPRTKALADPLRAAETPAARALACCETPPARIDVFTLCDIAKVVESPPPLADAGVAPPSPSL